MITDFLANTRAHTGVRRSPVSSTEPNLDRHKEGSKLAGVIYFHRISEGRFSGASERNFDTFRRLCGDAALKNAVLVTNMWGEVSGNIGEAREKELSSKIFKPALDNGA